MHQGITRKQALRLIGLGTAGALAAACAPAPTPTPVSPPKPAAPTPAPAPPTAAPAKAAEPPKPAAAAPTVAPTPTAAPKPAAPTPTAVAKPAAKEPVEIEATLWLDQTTETVFWDVTNGFTKNYQPLIKVKWSMTGAQYNEKLRTRIAAGTPPDIIWDGPGPRLINNVRAGVYVNLDSYIKADKEFKLSDFPESGMKFYIADGKVTCIPFGWCTGVLYSNKKVFDEAKVDMPTNSLTWDQYVEMAKALTKRDATGKVLTYGVLANGSYWPYLGIQLGAPGVFHDHGVWQKPAYDHPANIEGLQLLQDLVYKHKVAPDPGALKTQPWMAMFTGGRLAMNQNNIYTTNEWLKQKMDFFMTFEPMLKKRSSGYWTSGPAISVKSKYQDQAWEFTKFVTMGEGTRQFSRAGWCMAGVTKYFGDFLTDEVKKRGGQAAIDAVAWPDNYIPHTGPLGEKIASEVNPIIDLVMLNQKTPADAMKEAQAKAVKVIAAGG